MSDKSNNISNLNNLKQCLHYGKCRKYYKKHREKKLENI